MSDIRQPKATRTEFDFADARNAFRRGENVTQYLQRQLGVSQNTTEIIEMAYELQAGSYVEWTKSNRPFVDSYTIEMAEILNRHLADGQTILDVGTGELTTFSSLANKFAYDLERYYAFDVSWSRLRIGLEFAKEVLAPKVAERLSVFAAEMDEIPLKNSSIDTVITCHALEPNGGNERPILKELLRVARRKVILFEPSYELNSSQGRERMDRLGYVRNLEGVARELGATVDEVTPLKQVSNPLNPTVAYVLSPGDNVASDSGPNDELFSDPGTSNPLVKFASCYFSPKRGVAYPIIEGIPILRSRAAVLASALSDVDVSNG